MSRAPAQLGPAAPRHGRARPRPRTGPRRPRILATLTTTLLAVAALGATSVLAPGSAAASPTWSLDTSPNGGTQQNLLPAVSCLSPTACVAVGYFEDNNLVRQTLVESWNGTSWSIVSSPDQGTGNSELTGVSCVSPTWCQAVGDYDAGGGTTKNLVERWDGTHWSIVPSPDEGAASNSLGQIDCLSTAWCIAVGSFAGTGGVVQNLVESWDGTTWSIVASPDEGTHDNFLGNVSCTATTSCMAAGYDDNGSGVTQTLAASWDGSTWTIVPTPDVGTSSNVLTGVWCTSVTACIAVGDEVPTSPVVPGGIHAHNLVESWNGTAWSVVAAPEEGTESNNLSTVSCSSATSCVAVGSEYTGHAPSVSKTLIESWNGSVWAVVPSPDFGGAEAINLLLGLSCTPDGFCAAVGYHNLNTKTQTLIETLPGSGTPTSLATSLSGGGQTGTDITVAPGTAVTDRATLGGTDAATATGTVTYTVYSDSTCTVVAGSGGTVPVSGGAVAPSDAVTLASLGTYYWQATYSGDASSEAASASTCGPGDEIETVGPLAATPEAPMAIALPIAAGAVGGGAVLVRRRRRKRAGVV